MSGWDLGVSVRPTLIAFAASDELRQEMVGRVADRDRRRARHAALARAAERGGREGLDRLRHVGVGHDDDVVLGAAVRLHALAVPRGGLVDVLRDGRRADEGDGPDLRVGEEGVDALAAAVDDVEDALGQARLLEELGQRIAVSGTFSLGFRTNVFPQAIARGNIQRGTMAGKLKGVIPTHTPSGWSVVSQSTFRAMFSSVSPKRSVGAPQAYSMFSIPRKRLPRASASVLPCSRETVAQRRSKFSSTSCLYRNRCLARSMAGVSLQAGKAAAAASTAASTSAAPPRGHSAITSPVDGL
jgi:hypothetical protein